MILLLGGTSDSAPLAARLAEAGLRVLVSTATDVQLDLGTHENVERRTGPLDEAGLVELVQKRSIRAIVDATHPYATTIRHTARAVAERLDLPYLTLVRPAVIEPSRRGVTFADGHAEAARAAFGFGRTVLLTTGANNLAPYAAEARRTGLPLFARVLPREQSLAACQAAGLATDRIITGRGPFSVEQNRQHVRQCGAGVVVTKDGGKAARVGDKLQAAEEEHCRVVVVRRPKIEGDHVFEDAVALAAEVVRIVALERKT